ncbi:hypothetical protein IW261DRAFT_1517300 [Armillaria novae-zelandiae]|uniref:Uncharacterized protein n=1 Tax=Armillaria novae-zelandiae TaxID=153914 RepID=A0AA39NNR9_9AGAR|nr:hypothetical protein IW261DRAFT_1517300 [Armillaria novae-zelandiae]
MMTAGTYPATVTIPELTDSQIKDIVTNMDIGVNTIILDAFLYGIYTGVVAVTLCAVASRNNGMNHRRSHLFVAIILLLYLLEGFGLFNNWVLCITVYTTLAWTSVWETFILSNDSIPTAVALATRVTESLSSVLADTTMIWRCWIVWGRSWCVVLVPIACTTLATASRGIVAYYGYFEPSDMPPRAAYLEKAVSWVMLYSSFTMATWLWCTIFIIYRILQMGGTVGRMHIYQRVIEMLVESAFLYSVVTVVLLVFEGHNDIASAYIGDLAIVMRGMMPTILVGRIAAGHARPNDSWSDSTPGSSIRFGNHSTSQSDTEMSVGPGQDTSSTERPDLEEGLENIIEVQMEGALSIDSTRDYYHVVRISTSVDHSAV